MLGVIRASGLSVPWLVISMVGAAVLMFVSFATGLYIADSGDWGGEGGLLYRCIVWPGLGMRHLLGRADLPGGWLIPDVFQWALLTTLFYFLGTRWERRHAKRPAPARADLGKLPPDIAAQRWSCPKCGATTPNNAYACERCGYSVV